MSELTPIFGISQGQANEIISAYENDLEVNIALEGMDLHLFSKRKRDEHKKLIYIPCITIHTKYLNLAIFDYVLLTVGSKKHKKLLKVTPKAYNSQSISIFVR